METPDAPNTDPKDVELIDVKPTLKEKKELEKKPEKILKKKPEKKKKRKKLTVDIKITFCTHVGWDGVLVLLFSSCVAGMFIYITSLYTEQFQVWNKPFVWVFMLLSIVYTLLNILYICTWKKIAKSYTKEKGNARKRIKDMSFIKAAIHVKNMFSINGVYFLWKLYIFEFIENINQLINLVTIYLCVLPIEVSITFCLILAIDAFLRAYQLKQKYTMTSRDRQVKIDIVIDFLSMAMPLVTMGLVYKIPIQLHEMLQITAWPSVCLISKLRTMMRQITRARATNILIQEQAQVSANIKRNRRSIFSETETIRLIGMQNKNMPKKVSTGFCIYNILYGTFFLILSIVHLSVRPTGCEDIIWSDNCVNKIPFCKKIFEPTCNCATLVIKNNHSLTTLPNSLVEMNGLRRVHIWNCNLTSLPPEMEKLSEMVNFEISFNQLEQFDVDVSKWPKLARLFLMYNKITTYNVNALWTHQNIDSLDLNDNIGLQMPDQKVQINMPRLKYLHLGNNSMNATIRFDTTQFPNLRFLFLNGNKLIEFPDQSLKDTLFKLGIARCNLKSIPSYLSEFQKLKYIDARDNNISSIDSKLKDLISNNQIESYFSGNSICATDTSLDCKPVCSKYCWSRNVLSDGICDASCNSKVCEYDGGDCMATE